MKIEDIIKTKLEEIKKATLIGVKDMLNVEECSMLTGYTTASIYTFCNKRMIPHFKRGRLVFFSKKEIEDWLRETRVPTNDEISNEALTYMACKNLKAKPEANRGR